MDCEKVIRRKWCGGYHAGEENRLHLIISKGKVFILRNRYFFIVQRDFILCWGVLILNTKF